MKINPIRSIIKNQRGVSAIIIVIFILFVGVGIIAFVVDIGYLHVVKNEIQNAADAGALAGANDLFLPNGDINTNANQTANIVATSNKSGGNSVEVNLPLTNIDDVQRGHWSFGTQSFQQSDNLTQSSHIFDPGYNWDSDPAFINAVKVVTHNTQIPSFFGKILGHSGYQRTSDAVAVRTVPGEFQPGEFDYPVAICIQAIINGSDFSCNIGRMLNSGTNADTHNTGGWTNFSQPCVTANPSNIPTGCGEGNSGSTYSLMTGQGMGTVGGVQQSVLTAIRNCFFDPTTKNERLEEDGSTTSVLRDIDGDGIVDIPLVATLPVIDCPGNNISNCATLLTAVNVQIVWISEGGTGQLTAPTKMYKSAFPSGPGDEHWTPPNDPSDVSGNWDSFVSYFGLENSDGADAPLQIKALYFKPECEVADIAGSGAGGPGGPFFGIFSKTSVLVE